MQASSFRVATSASEWSFIHSLALVATLSTDSRRASPEGFFVMHRVSPGVFDNI